MYEDCMERFSCNRAPDRCSAICYKPIKTHKKVVKITNHNDHCGKNIIPNLRYVEGPPGRDGIDGRGIEFEWEGTRVKTRLEGEDNWTYSPNLQGIRGQQGPQGYTPYVGENGNWHINGEDLGINAYTQIVVETAKDSEKLGGQEPSYYATSEALKTHTHYVGGRNYIIDSKLRMLDGTDQWGNYGCTTIENGAVKLVPKEDGNVYKIGIPLSEPTVKGETYTISFEVLTTNDVTFGFGMGAGNIKATANEGWQKLTKTFTMTSDGVTTMTITMATVKAGQTYYYRKFKLEKGAVVTDWSPTEEDGKKYKTDKFITADSLEFDITKDMVGCRVMCTWDYGKKINLPSPKDVGKGAIIEISNNCNNMGRFTEVYTPSGKIYKDNFSSTKCIQPCFTTRKYISTGTDWITDSIPVETNNTLKISIDPINGSDTEPKFYSGDSGSRLYKSITDLDMLLREYPKILFQFVSAEPLIITKSMTFVNKYIAFKGYYTSGSDLNNFGGTLQIPSSYQINLHECHLVLEQCHIKISGVGFKLYQKCNIDCVSYYYVYIHAYEDVGTTVFEVASGAAITFACQRLGLRRDMTEYTARYNLFKYEVDGAYGTSPIQLHIHHIEKPEDVYYCGASNTISRVGTSKTYFIG